MWQTSRCMPYDRNARIIPESAVGKVADSIEKFGFNQPIVVDAEGVIIAGHTRLLAAQRLGLKDVPVFVVSGLTAEEEQAYRLADNRSADEAQWDFDLLQDAFEELLQGDFDLTLTGFDEVEIASIPTTGDVVFPEYDESAADSVVMHTCPNCGHVWPA